MHNKPDRLSIKLTRLIKMLTIKAQLYSSKNSPINVDNYSKCCYMFSSRASIHSLIDLFSFLSQPPTFNLAKKNLNKRNVLFFQLNLSTTKNKTVFETIPLEWKLKKIKNIHISDVIISKMEMDGNDVSDDLIFYAPFLHSWMTIAIHMRNYVGTLWMKKMICLK